MSNSDHLMSVAKDSAEVDGGRSQTGVLCGLHNALADDGAKCQLLPAGGQPSARPHVWEQPADTVAVSSMCCRPPSASNPCPAESAEV